MGIVSRFDVPFRDRRAAGACALAGETRRGKCASTLVKQARVIINAAAPLLSHTAHALCVSAAPPQTSPFFSARPRIGESKMMDGGGHTLAGSSLTAGVSPPRLYIFGDSWASADYGDIDTWPELLSARHYAQHGKSINMAQAYCGSDGLDWQLKRLRMDLAASSASGLASAPSALDLAIIHAGGNDLYHATPKALAAIAACGGCCGRLLPPLALRLATNLQTLVEGLIRIGIRRIAIVGVPLTANVPLIARPASGVPGLVSWLGCVMGGCNRVLLAAMHKALEDAQNSTRVALHTAVVLDEARAIDETHATADDAPRLWYDVSHPSQALHAMLADAFEMQLAKALPPPNLTDLMKQQQQWQQHTADDRDWEGDVDNDEGAQGADERDRLLARTPLQRTALRVDD